MFPLVRSFFVVQLFTSALAGTYRLSDNIQGSGFLSKFNVESISDPTHGRVLVILSFFYRCSVVNTLLWTIEIMSIPRLPLVRTWLMPRRTTSWCVPIQRPFLMTTARAGTQWGFYRKSGIPPQLWCELNFQFSSRRRLKSFSNPLRFNIRHMPQGCGWVYSILFRIQTRFISSQNLARSLDLRRRLATPGGY